MTRAKFDNKQPAVTANGDYFQIALNETVIHETVETMEGQEATNITMYEYDWNEFRDSTLTLEEVEAHPEQYIDYVPKPIPVTPAQKKQSIEEQLASIKENQEMMEQAVQDLTLMMMGE